MFHYAVSIFLGLIKILTLAASLNEKTCFILLPTACLIWWKYDLLLQFNMFSYVVSVYNIQNQFVVKPWACKCLITMSRMVANNLCSSYEIKAPKPATERLWVQVPLRCV